MKENYRKIKGYDGYEVSDLGNVRSLKNGRLRVLSTYDNGIGYLFVTLCKNGKTKQFLVHRLVYEAFIGPIPPGMTVDHVNNVKTDNRLSNLQLLTQGDNTRKAHNKQLKLTNAKTCAKYTFSNSYEASAFFGYKTQTQIGDYIFRARKRGNNWINIRGEKHYFAQSA